MISTCHPLVNIKQWIAVLCCFIILAGCSSEAKEETQGRTTVTTTPAKDSLSATVQAPVETQEPVPSCDCISVKDYGYTSEGVRLDYGGSEQDLHEQDSILNHYLHDPVSLKTKTLILGTNEALPSDVKAFKDVEHIIFHGRLTPAALTNLELFPKLVSVIFYAGRVELDTTQGWLKRVEKLAFFKCKIKGLRSFRQTPRLKSLTIGHSGFEYFPKDFNSLACLQEFNIEEYKFGKDQPQLADIDLTRFACLKTFRVWGGASGLPQGVDSIGKIKLTLRPWAMSETELKTYKAWKARIKNAG